MLGDPASAFSHLADGHGECLSFFFWPHCTTCGILVPRPGIEPTSSAVEARSLKHWTAREVPVSVYLEGAAESSGRISHSWDLI